MSNQLILSKEPDSDKSSTNSDNESVNTDEELKKEIEERDKRRKKFIKSLAKKKDDREQFRKILEAYDKAVWEYEDSDDE